MNNILWFDIESTALEIWKAKIIEFAFIYKDKEISIMMNPMVPITNSFIHKITDEMVKDLKPFSFYAEKIYNILKDCDSYGGYNLRSYDMNVLALELSRCGYTIPEKPIIDVYEQIKLLEQSKKLKDVYLRMSKKKLDNAHSGLADIKATRELNDIINKEFFS